MCGRHGSLSREQPPPPGLQAEQQRAWYLGRYRRCQSSPREREEVKGCWRGIQLEDRRMRKEQVGKRLGALLCRSLCCPWQPGRGPPSSEWDPDGGYPRVGSGVEQVPQARIARFAG